jgi:hypothetical protein
MRIERESLGNIGQSSPDFLRYTEFQMKYLEMRCKTYMRRKVTRLKLDKTIENQKQMTKIVDSICPKGRTTIVFFGNGKQAANSSIKG